MAWETYVTDTGTGLLSGAATGATIGSLFPGPGTVIGAGIGGLIGGISGLVGAGDKAEQLEQARAMARGEVPAAYRDMMAEQLGGYYDDMRYDLGGYLGRSGLSQSSIAGRVMADTYQQQGQALADALTRASQQRMALGQDILAQRNAELAGIGSNLVGAVGMLHAYRNSQPQKPAVNLATSPLGMGSATSRTLQKPKPKLGGGDSRWVRSQTCVNRRGQRQ